MDSNLKTLLDELKINVIQFSSIEGLLEKSYCKGLHGDLIIIDIEKFYKNDDTDCFSLFYSLDTIINLNYKLKTPIVLAVNLKTDVSKIKDMLLTNINGIYLEGDTISEEEKKNSIISLLEGKCFIPQKIQNLLVANKNKLEKNKIILTPRQKQILNLIVSKGSSYKVIAKILRISESTVKMHITSILKKYGLRNRTQLALFARNNSVI